MCFHDPCSLLIFWSLSIPGMVEGTGTESVTWEHLFGTQGLQCIFRKCWKKCKPSLCPSVGTLRFRSCSTVACTVCSKGGEESHTAAALMRVNQDPGFREIKESSTLDMKRHQICHSKQALKNKCNCKHTPAGQRLVQSPQGLCVLCFFICSHSLGALSSTFPLIHPLLHP